MGYHIGVVIVGVSAFPPPSGLCLILIVGIVGGIKEDMLDGSIDGIVDGFNDGSNDGSVDCIFIGIADGNTNPDRVDFGNGIADGSDKPKADGNADGLVDGCANCSNEGSVDGNANENNKSKIEYVDGCVLGTPLDCNKSIMEGVKDSLVVTILILRTSHWILHFSVLARATAIFLTVGNGG